MECTKELIEKAKQLISVLDKTEIAVSPSGETYSITAKRFIDNEYKLDDETSLEDAIIEELEGEDPLCGINIVEYGKYPDLGEEFVSLAELVTKEWELQTFTTLYHGGV